jgi:hypothetical protein
MTGNKKTRVKHMTIIGRYHDTFNAIYDPIPESIKRKLSSRELCLLMDHINEIWCIAKNKGVEEFAEHHSIEGCAWSAKITQVKELSTENFI